MRFDSYNVFTYAWGEERSFARDVPSAMLDATTDAARLKLAAGDTFGFFPVQFEERHRALYRMATETRGRDMENFLRDRLSAADIAMLVAFAEGDWD